MRKLAVTAASLFWIVSVLPLPQTASFERSFTLANSSNRTITEVYLRRIDISTFSRDLLGNRVIPPGSSTDLEPVWYQGYCRYDVEIVFDDNTLQTLRD